MISTYNLLVEATRPLEDFVRGAEESGAVFNSQSGKRTVNLRLDFEYPEDWPKNAMVHSMFSVFRDDLMDVVTNGDTANHNDPLLKCFDGEIKRGKRLSHIEFPVANLYWEHKPKKNSYEYTLFVIVYVEFGGSE